MADTSTKVGPDLVWGRQTAELLWTSYAAMNVDFSGKRLLDFGCAWGYVCELALERGCAAATGVDAYPHWKRLADQSWAERPGLRLEQGDILQIEALQSQTFDIIVSSGTLFLLDSEYVDRVLAWFYDHLEPGGAALLRTRCMTAKSFNDLGTRLKVPGAQLLFSRKDIDALLTDQGYKELKHHLCYTGASWIFACHGAGFTVVDVQRFSNTDVVKMAETHRAKTRFLDPIELASSEILISLRRPSEVRDLSTLRKR